MQKSARIAQQQRSPGEYFLCSPRSLSDIL